MTADFGDLKLIDIRERWQSESQEFTPWLARSENILRLSEAIGIELEVERTEVSVGPYYADVLARDTATGGYVVIENQLNKTDHSHLGQLLTYAAGLDATTIVWVAKEFTEEHKRALDWLNENLSEDVSLYGVVVEVWQIDQSRPAVKFRTVSGPPQSIKRIPALRTDEELTDSKRLQLEFWTEFREKLLQTGKFVSAQKADPKYWFDVSLGRTGIHLSAFVNTSDDRLGLRVYLSNRHNGKLAIKQLIEQKDAIERELGEALEWDPNPSARDKVIVLRRNVNVRDKSKWPEYLDWLVTKTVDFRRVFGPRVKQLRLESEDQSEPEEG